MPCNYIIKKYVNKHVESFSCLGEFLHSREQRNAGNIGTSLQSCEQIVARTVAEIDTKTLGHFVSLTLLRLM